MATFMPRVAALVVLAALTPASGVRLGAADAAPIRMVFAGQALIKHDLCATAPEKSAAMATLLAGYDVVFTNLEVAIDNGRGTPTKSGEYFHATKPDVLDCLEQWHFNLLALSNNHSWDLGAGGILGTIEEVQARGFAHAGTGSNLVEASAPGYLKTARGRVALVSMSSGGGNAAAGPDRPGINAISRIVAENQVAKPHAERIFQALQAAAKEADYVICYMHDHYWAPDYQDTPDWKKRFARECIDAGATVFVSHGAPLLQGIEIYRGRPIFYSLGSIVFHTVTPVGHYRPAVWETVLAQATFAKGQLQSLRLRPMALNERGDGEPGSPEFLQSRGVPVVATGEQARDILERVRRLSAEYGLKSRIEDGIAVVEMPSNL